MPLRPVTDTSPADWFVDSDVPWHVKICLGPPGFEAYARVFFDIDGEPPVSDTEVMGRVLDSLANHTATADIAYVGVWTGWGFWAKEHHPDATSTSEFSIPNRDYLLLTGPLADALDRKSLGLEGDSDGAVPHLLWPYDHAWFLAADVDPDWFGIGGSAALIEELLADDNLDVEASTYDASNPEER